MTDSPEQQLEALHGRMRACRQCLDAGYDVFPRAIFSGEWGARVMLVGQAPGITEKDAGRPFNAGSGKRLFQWLALGGIEESWFRSRQYMTSVTKCYPGRARGGSGDRLPGKVEQQLCRPFLDQQIALLNPELIIPVGRLAIGLFYPDNPPLEQIIGGHSHKDGRWIAPLPHPSGASRWHQTADNRQLVQQAALWIGDYIRTHVSVRE